MGRLVRETDGMENTTTHYIFDEEEGALKGTLKYMHHRTIEGQAIQYLSYAYDGFARLVRTTEQRPSGTYITDLEYDECSRISASTYPTGVSIKNEYGNGYLRRILDADGHVLWKTNGINAYGQLTDAMLGNGTTTHRAYKEDMHYLDSIVTSNNLQNLSYGYDNFGNLASRKDNLRNLEETFHYDNMNRLTDIYLGNTHSQIMYDPLGRMTSKQADGQTVFANADFTGVPGQPVRPHAMKSAATADGVFPTASQTITYTSFDKVKSIGEDGKGLVYTYGYDHQRIRAFEAFSDHTVNKDYVGVCEYITEDHGAGGATFKTLTYLVGPFGVFAVVEKQNNEESIHYILKDHLGSWTTITDSEGNVEQELSFDAWGNLRNPATWSGSFSGTPMFDRGFTGHEHMTAFGLINMNGRCYDPLTSSFLSVDAYVQDPASAQAFNRYAYCNYNPLRYTDPTGWVPNRNGYEPIHFNETPHTQWHSNDPNDVIWGRSVHPCASGNLNGISFTSSGYTIGNGYVTGPVPPSHLKAIRAWQDNPCKETSQALEDLGITVNVGCFYGSLYGEDGFRASIYNWTDAAGQAYNATVLDCVGGNENTWYVMTNKSSGSYDNIDITSRMISIGGLYTTFESALHFSKTLGIFTDKRGTIRHFVGEPNKNLRKKMNYGKATSMKYTRVGQSLGLLGVSISIYQSITANTTDAKLEYSIDAIIGSAAVLKPEIFGIPATLWFLGGRNLVKWYGKTTITPMIKEGINPGTMENQPFK